MDNVLQQGIYAVLSSICYRRAARPFGSTSGRMDLLVDGYSQLPTATRTAFLHDHLGMLAGVAVWFAGLGDKFCAVCPALLQMLDLYWSAA
jgi:hypothetical protein